MEWMNHLEIKPEIIIDTQRKTMSENPQIRDKRLFYKLNMAQRQLLKYADREMTTRLGIPMAQTAALFFLMKNDGCRLNALSRVLMQNKSAITTLVERMEKNSLIVKKKSKTDGRAFNLYLTDKGRDIGNAARPLTAAYNQELTKPFSSSEIKIIHRFLDHLIETYG